MKRQTVVMLAVLSAACGKKESEPPKTGEPPAPAPAAPPTVAGEPAKTPPAAPAPVPPKLIPPADTSQLWALAPANATFGLVVGDGVPIRVVNGLGAMVKQLEGKPFAAKIMVGIHKMRSGPLDAFDEASYKKNGFDLSKGAALFVAGDFERPLLIVLPVSDREAWRKIAEGKLDKVGEREVDKFDHFLCVAGARYVCADNLDDIDAALKSHDSDLSAAVKALPPESRGDVELYVDLIKTTAVARQLRDLKEFGDFTAVAASLRLDGTGLTMKVSAKGTMSPLAAMLAASEPPGDFRGATAGAATVMRWRFDPKLLAAARLPPSMPIGDADLRTDLIDQITGDFQVITAGQGLVSGAIMVKVIDAARVKKAVAALCGAAKSAKGAPLANLSSTDTSCSADVVIPKGVIDIAPIKLSISVAADMLLVRMGDVDLASLKGLASSDAASDEAREVLNGSQTLAIWSRSAVFDVSQLPKLILDKISEGDREALMAVELMNWIGSQIYEGALGVSVSATGVQAVARLTGFGGDPADARAAYEAAVEKLAAGDRAAYLAGLDEIEKKFPSALVARRAGFERKGTPVMGPAFALVAGAGAAFAMKRHDSASFGGVPAPEPPPPAPPASNP